MRAEMVVGMRNGRVSVSKNLVGWIYLDPEQRRAEPNPNPKSEQDKIGGKAEDRKSCL